MYMSVVETDAHKAALDVCENVFRRGKYFMIAITEGLVPVCDDEVDIFGGVYPLDYIGVDHCKDFMWNPGKYIELSLDPLFEQWFVGELKDSHQALDDKRRAYRIILIFVNV